jgi:uncharacterized protein YjaZ
MNKEDYVQMKLARRQKKRSNKRGATADEVIFIFEKVIEGWKTIRIYNTIIQKNPASEIDKKKTETIASGNCRLYDSELSKERYQYYTELREKVYEYNIHIIDNK